MSDFNFLKSYCRLLDNTEVPPRFTIWTGIATLLAALETRVYINQGVYVIRPNFYMVLVAPSGLKKSTAVNLPARLLNALNPRLNVISQKITPEALISSLKKLTEQKADSNGVKTDAKTKCGGIIIADELATFLDRGALDRGLGPMLTTLFDCGPFEYTTMARGVERLENSYLSLLGGSTIELLRTALPKDAIGGGFTSRTLFIYEDRRPAPVPWVEFDEQLVRVEHDLVAYLQRLMTLAGPITLTPPARSFYESNYRQRYANIGEQPGLAQYENRRHAHLFKVAMAFMVSEEPQLVMTEVHLMRANAILEEAEGFLPRVMELLVASDIGHANNLILDFIRAKKIVTRSELVRRFSMQHTASEITVIIDTLGSERGGGMIKLDSIEGKLAYRYVGVGK